MFAYTGSQKKEDAGGFFLTGVNTNGPVRIDEESVEPLI